MSSFENKLSIVESNGSKEELSKNIDNLAKENGKDDFLSDRDIGKAISGINNLILTDFKGDEKEKFKLLRGVYKLEDKLEETKDLQEKKDILVDFINNFVEDKLDYKVLSKKYKLELSYNKLNNDKEKIEFFKNNDISVDFFKNNIRTLVKDMDNSDSASYDQSLLKYIVNNKVFKEYTFEKNINSDTFVIDGMIKNNWENELFSLEDIDLVNIIENDSYYISIILESFSNIDENLLITLFDKINFNEDMKSEISNTLIDNEEILNSNFGKSIIKKYDLEGIYLFKEDPEYETLYFKLDNSLGINLSDFINILGSKKEDIDNFIDSLSKNSELNVEHLIDLSLFNEYIESLAGDNNKIKDTYEKYFTFLSIFGENIGDILDNGSFIYNELYDGGYLPGEEDQIEVSKKLDCKTILLLLSGTQNDSLNISHKTLTWRLLGNPDKKIKGFSKNEIIDSYKELNNESRMDFVRSMFGRTGRESELFKDFNENERSIFLKDMVNNIIDSGDYIYNYKGILKFLDNELYGKQFGKELYNKLSENTDNYKKDVLALSSMSESFKDIVMNDNKFNISIDSLNNIEKEINNSGNLDVNKALGDGEWRSVTLFVWDPKNTDDSQNKDKRMQLSDFNSTMKLDLAEGYKLSQIVGSNGKNIDISDIDLSTDEGKKKFYDDVISKGKLNKVIMEKEVNGIKDIHELVLSNNNSKQDFKKFAESKNSEGNAIYDQIDIRGHCWTNEEALGLSDYNNFDRDNELLLINGGCFQEKHTQEYSEKLNNKVFQVATTQTGLGQKMTSKLSVQYRKLILEEYTKQRDLILKSYKTSNSDYKGSFNDLPDDIKSKVTVNMKDIDNKIREQKYFKNLVNRNMDAKGVTLTTEGVSRILSRVDSELFEDELDDNFKELLGINENDNDNTENNMDRIIAEI